MTLCWLSVLIWILKAGNPCRVIHKLIPYKYNVHTQNLFYFKFSYFQKIISIFLKEIDWCFTLAKSLRPRSETGPCSFGNEDHVNVVFEHASRRQLRVGLWGFVTELKHECGSSTVSHNSSRFCSVGGNNRILPACRCACVCVYVCVSVCS